MSRRDEERLNDIHVAIAAIASHLRRGDISDGLIFDAVRVRLIEIGEAVKAIDSELLETEPNVPWQAVMGMRDRLAHHYFDTSHAILQTTIDEDVPILHGAVERLRGRLSNVDD